ncbi:MAG: 2-oxoacid:acceptor oxidoreductase subunit alpha [Deltaproteobacteria bacterium]|nr:2-oxoacid:acceptor oxidoreductase subunit alpha [Candidatus Anaeroferrophillus wilburensis]MBN2888522.1 2-oxoacid:acceptor oxidoreductase subunit alpha [Deltaproteobacteria bacterium]
MSSKSHAYRLMQGNEAVAEGALAAGVRFFAGYPITPSTEIAEILSSRLPALGGKFIQMEDEIASIAAIIGASLGGMKSLTATSGPGFSLMQENLGYACLTEIPIVIVNVMRGGPSTGLPTSPSQGDVMQARWGTHGDHPIIVLCPSSVEEAFHYTIKAVNFAEKYRNPVILLMDEVIGHMRARVDLPPWSMVETVSRIKPSMPPEWYIPYERTSMGVSPMASFGDGYRYHVTGLVHDMQGFPTGKPREVQENIISLFKKIERGFKEICLVDYLHMDDAEYAIVAYGCMVLSAQSAVEQLRAAGIKVGLIKFGTLWPFPRFALERFLPQLKTLLVPELNMGQIYREVLRVNAGHSVVEKINKINGEIITPEEIIKAIKGTAR